MRTGADRTLELLEAQVGRPLAEVETPVAVVDLDRLEANLRDLQSYADAHGIALWPHTKTHKSPEIGLRQLELGAGGLTVAKTGEAEVFRDAGAPRLLVHYPPIGDAKWERLARLAAEGIELTVAVDGFVRRRGALRRARAGTARRRDAARGARRRAAPHRADDGGRAPRRSRSGCPRCPRSRSPASAATPATAAETRPRSGRASGEVDALAARDPRRVPRRRAALRSHLRRLDADALPHARDLCQRAPLRHVRAARPHRRSRRRSTRARCTSRSPSSPMRVPGQIVIDAGSKTLTSDTHARAGQRRDRRHARTRDLHTINEEHGYVDVSRLRERPADRRPPARHPEPRLRLREPARRAAGCTATASSTA